MLMIIKKVLILLITLSGCVLLRAQENFITTTPDKTSFSLVANGKAASLLVDEADYPGVLRAVNDLQRDVQLVTSITPSLKSLPSEEKLLVVIGTIGKSKFIDELIRNKKIRVHDATGKWETYFIQVVDKPMKGVDRALVVAGSDKRGTVYGIYEISKQIGVSPWYWWADVPVETKKEIYINNFAESARLRN